MLSDTDTDEPWFALSKDNYQTILNRALSEMEEPPVLPPSMVLSNCSELIKLLNQDDGLGLGSGGGGELNAAATSRRGRSAAIDNKRQLDRTEKSSAVVVAEKIPRRSAEIDTTRSNNRTNYQETAKGVWKYSSVGCPNRLAPGKANAGIDCSRNIAKHKPITRRANTEIIPALPRGLGVKLEMAQNTTESRTLNLSLNQRNCKTSSSQNTNSRYPLRIPKAFNLRPHDNGGKPFSASATKRYATRSGVTERTVLNDLLTVETKSIPKIDLKTPTLVPCVSLERKVWSSSSLAFGKSEPVEGATLKVESAYPVKEQLLLDDSSTLGTRRLDNTRKFDPICFPDASRVRNVTELEIFPDSWPGENSVSAEFPLFTDALAEESDIRPRSFDKQEEVYIQLRPMFSTVTGDSELHSRRGNDQPRSGWKQDSEVAETPSPWPSRNPGFEASCLERNEHQRNPISQATKSQCDEDERPPGFAKTLQLGTCFGEEPKPFFAGPNQETAADKTDRNYVSSKRVQQLWAVVDKTVVSSMMEKILERETNNISANDLRGKTTKRNSAPSELAALLSSDSSEESVKNSTDFPNELERSHQYLNKRQTLINDREQLRDLLNDDIIGDVIVHGFSIPDRCQISRSDDVKSKDAVLCDVSTYEAALDDLKQRGGASANAEARRATVVKVEPDLDAGNNAKAALNDIVVDVAKVDVSRMSFKWKSNILLRLRKDQISAKKWYSSGTLYT